MARRVAPVGPRIVLRPEELSVNECTVIVRRRVISATLTHFLIDLTIIFPLVESYSLTAFDDRVLGKVNGFSVSFQQYLWLKLIIGLLVFGFGIRTIRQGPLIYVKSRRQVLAWVVVLYTNTLVCMIGILQWHFAIIRFGGVNFHKNSPFPLIYRVMWGVPPFAYGVNILATILIFIPFWQAWFSTGMSSFQQTYSNMQQMVLRSDNSALPSGLAIDDIGET